MNCKVICVVFACCFVAIATAGPVVDDKGHNENAISEKINSVSAPVVEDLDLSPSESSEQGDARKKKDNNMGGMMAAILMKIGILKALAFKALVLLVGKALLVSKLALVLAAVIGLKKLLHSEKHVTYEVVSHPHHEHHEHHDAGHDSYGGGGGGGWGRSFDAKDASKMAYSAQIPAQKPAQ